jgi:hypothetical protein
MTHRIVAAVLLLSALAPSLASAEPTSPHAIDVDSEAHARFGFAPVDLGPEQFENSSGPAHSLFVFTAGGQRALSPWLAITGSIGGAAMLREGNEGVPDGNAMWLPFTLGVVVATSVRDDVRVGGELVYSPSVGSDDSLRAADAAASVFLHDTDIAWSQSDRVRARGAATWRDDHLAITAGLGVTTYVDLDQSVAEASLGVAYALDERWSVHAGITVYTDVLDEGHDEGSDVAAALVAGIRRKTGDHWDVGLTLSQALVERADIEGDAGFGIAFDLRWTP